MRADAPRAVVVVIGVLCGAAWQGDAAEAALGVPGVAGGACGGRCGCDACACGAGHRLRGAVAIGVVGQAGALERGAVCAALRPGGELVGRIVGVAPQAGVGAAGDGLAGAVVGGIIDIGSGGEGAAGLGDGLGGEAVIGIVRHGRDADACGAGGVSGPGFELLGDVAQGIVLPAELGEDLALAHGGGAEQGAVHEAAEGVVGVAAGLAIAGDEGDGTPGEVVAVAGDTPAFADHFGAVVRIVAGLHMAAGAVAGAGAVSGEVVAIAVGQPGAGMAERCQQVQEAAQEAKPPAKSAVAALLQHGADAATSRLVSKLQSSTPVLGVSRNDVPQEQAEQTACLRSLVCRRLVKYPASLPGGLQGTSTGWWRGTCAGTSGGQGRMLI